MIPTWIGNTLVPMEKMEVHRRGLRHKAVSVFVLHGDRMLIQRRAETKYHSPGLWTNTCCTHPLWGEDPRACAVRRIDEELGITGLAPIYKGRVEYRADVGNGMVEHEVVEAFVAHADGDLHYAPNPQEVAEATWIDLDRLADEADRQSERFTPWLRIYLAQHRATIFGARA